MFSTHFEVILLKLAKHSLQCHCQENKTRVKLSKAPVYEQCGTNVSTYHAFAGSLEKMSNFIKTNSTQIYSKW